MIGDCGRAVVGAGAGSVDWLCCPRFDSDACFAALLGTAEHGRWIIAPASAALRVRRRYRDKTLVLEIEFATEDGPVTVIDFMSITADRPTLSRVLEGLRGRVAMRTELVDRQHGRGSCRERGCNKVKI